MSFQTRNRSILPADHLVSLDLSAASVLGAAMTEYLQMSRVAVEPRQVVLIGNNHFLGPVVDWSLKSGCPGSTAVLVLFGTDSRLYQISAVSDRLP